MGFQPSRRKGASSIKNFFYHKNDTPILTLDMIMAIKILLCAPALLDVRPPACTTKGGVVVLDLLDGWAALREVEVSA